MPFSLTTMSNPAPDKGSMYALEAILLLVLLLLLFLSLLLLLLMLLLVVFVVVVVNIVVGGVGGGVSFWQSFNRLYHTTALAAVILCAKYKLQIFVTFYRSIFNG